jgi:toxin-antitoxin system PIN domain toxin
MIAVDTNLLVFAHRGSSPHHSAALTALQPLFEGASPWALPWPCVHEFLSIATHPKIYSPPSTLAEALAFLDSLFSSPQIVLLAESPGYFDTLRQISTAAHLKGPRIHDARVAALCLHHGVSELWSADRDFSAFPQLNVRNPLVATGGPAKK